MRRLPTDACVLINLCATDRLGEIAASLSVRFVVVEQVADETFYLRSELGAQEPRTLVDLETFIAQGVIEIVSLEDHEFLDCL